MAKIPPHAKKVFEGKIFNVYQWEQEMFDGTTEIFECLERPNTAVVIPLVGDKIFVQHEEQPNKPSFWTVPAGRFNPNETDPIVVGQRELLEETGYEAKSFHIIKELEPQSKIQWTTYIMVARDCIKVRELNLDGGEKIHDSKLLTFDEFIDFSQKQENFRVGEIATECLKAFYDSKEKEILRKMIYGK